MLMKMHEYYFMCVDIKEQSQFLPPILFVTVHTTVIGDSPFSVTHVPVGELGLQTPVLLCLAFA